MKNSDAGNIFSTNFITWREVQNCFIIETAWNLPDFMVLP